MRNNQWRWVHDRSTVFESDRDGSPIRLLGLVEDITSRQDQFRTWKRLERALPGVLYSLVMAADQSPRYSFVAGHTVTYFGVTPEQICQDAQRVLMTIHADDRPQVLATRQKAALSQQDQLCEYRLNTPTGLQWVEDRMSPDLDPGGHTILHGVIVQITQRKTLEDKLTRLSNTDELTGLYNRRYLRSSLESQAIHYQTTGQPFSVVVIDLDLFKQLNDEHGHLMGDAVLARLADLLRSQLRASDVAGRTGGEEFLLVLPETDQKAAFDLAEKIRKELSQITFRDPSAHSFSVTLSAGIATAQGPAQTYEAIWNQADKALYQAKKSGRNRVYIEPFNPIYHQPLDA